MLIQTITMETKDERLFAKPVPLLAAACELVYHTVACSPLNAEELRRERGFEILEEALGRCVAQLNASSKPDDLGVQVCMNIASCFSVASQFEQCRERLAEMPDVIRDLCRLLFYSVNSPFSPFISSISNKKQKKIEERLFAFVSPNAKRITTLQLIWPDDSTLTLILVKLKKSTGDRQWCIVQCEHTWRILFLSEIPNE